MTGHLYDGWFWSRDYDRPRQVSPWLENLRHGALLAALKAGWPMWMAKIEMVLA